MPEPPKTYVDAGGQSWDSSRVIRYLVRPGMTVSQGYHVYWRENKVYRVVLPDSWGTPTLHIHVEREPLT